MSDTNNTAGSGLHDATCSDSPPPRKVQWNHSERVLVWYRATEGHPDTFSIAYYHYAPPFEKAPKWIDFSGHSHGRTPEFWWSLPIIPNVESIHPESKP